jgi:RimJ/RimL family protein N-acetyltransferase
MKVIETERLFLRHLASDDAEFILELVNEPAWIQNIGERNVRTIADARSYISDKFAASYEQFGFGLYLVELKEESVPIGICGLVKRESLEDADIGFAFLQRFWSKGYAYESASAVMDYARNKLGISRIVAITAPDNQGSVKVLEKIGFQFEKTMKLPGADEEIKFFISDK